MAGAQPRPPPGDPGGQNEMGPVPPPDGTVFARPPRRLAIRHFDRQPPPERGPRMNDQIRVSPVRLIGAGGEQLGVVPTARAQERARSSGLDLVEMVADERPPVCKILDYGKMRYEK